jgi:hypothetical protein
MPTTAQPTRNKQLRRTHGAIPRGYSADNGALAACAIASFMGFYGASEVLSQSAPQFSFDDASIVERIVKEALKQSLAQLQSLLTWEAGWNGYDALPPGSEVVARAEDWIVKLFLAVADLGRIWIHPNVTASADGEVVFEWWYGQKKLTVYVTDESVDYVQVWGTDMDTEMSDGNAEPLSTCRSLWLWLVS